MWDDVIIGDGIRGNSATSARTFSKGLGDISENKTSYWISRVYLNLGMTIFKDTPIGKHLTKIIESESPEAVNEYLKNTLIANIDSTSLARAADIAIRDAFNEGSRSRAKEIRNSLGIK